jgi:hypothetical protein
MLVAVFEEVVGVGDAIAGALPLFVAKATGGVDGII